LEDAAASSLSQERREQQRGWGGVGKGKAADAGGQRVAGQALRL
jgi:hypothetical protein